MKEEEIVGEEAADTEVQRWGDECVFRRNEVHCAWAKGLDHVIRGEARLWRAFSDCPGS
jgi:hypothetical protein